MVPEKKQLTVRLPVSIVNYITKKAKDENKAVNEVIVDITEEYMKWQKGEETLRNIAMIREKAKHEYGIHPDSVDEIRRLREGDE